MTKRKTTKGQTTIHKTLHRTGGELMCSVPAPLVIPVVLLLNDMNIFWYGNRVEHHYT